MDHGGLFVRTQLLRQSQVDVVILYKGGADRVAAHGEGCGRDAGGVHAATCVVTTGQDCTVARCPLAVIAETNKH